MASPATSALGMPHRVHAVGLVPPLQVLVLNIIVEQREVVDQLQRRGGGHGAGEVGVEGLAGEHTQGGTQGFTLR